MNQMRQSQSQKRSTESNIPIPKSQSKQRIQNAGLSVLNTGNRHVSRIPSLSGPRGNSSRQASRENIQNRPPIKSKIQEESKQDHVSVNKSQQQLRRIGSSQRVSSATQRKDSMNNQFGMKNQRGAQMDRPALPKGPVQRPPLKQQPKVEMMPSLRRKQELNAKHKKQCRFIARGFPKGILLDIILFCCNERFKIGLKLQRVCKTFYEICHNQQRYWLYLFAHKYPQDFYQLYYLPLGLKQIEVQDQSEITNAQLLLFINNKLDDLYFDWNDIRNFDWKATFLQKTIQLEKAAHRKNTAMFKKVFIDSWRKSNIQPLIRKLDLSFQVIINNDIKYFISNAKTNVNKKLRDRAPKIQFNQESLSFDLVFDNHILQCPKMHEISNLRILAVCKSQNLIKTIVDMDFSQFIQLASENMRKSSNFVRLKTVNIDQMTILDNSSILIGYYPDNQLASRSRYPSQNKKNDQGSPPSFFTLNLLYIDLLKQITAVQSILNEKYCDIDSTFGLHDYNIQIELRNQRQVFFHNVFRKVFTKLEDLEKPQMKNRQNDNGGWANFDLIQSESNDRYYSKHRFEGKPFYTFDNMITIDERLHDTVILDFVITDEFNEPLHYASQAVKITQNRLFDNGLNIDLSKDRHLAEMDGSSVSSILYEGTQSSQQIEQNIDKFGAPKQQKQVVSKGKQQLQQKPTQFILAMQMDFNDQEQYTYITNINLKISLDAINQRFNTNY